jgi:DNA-binding Lrp family transcriptional regulator
MDMVLAGSLPLDGREIRAEDLFDHAEELHVSSATLAKYLRIWEKKGLVQRSAAIIEDRPAIFYRLALDKLWPGARKNLYRVLGYEDEWADLFRRREEGFRTRADLERFLRIQDAVLWVVLFDLLTQAAETGSQDEARERAETVVDYVLRRWIASLAEVMWVRRKDSASALLRVSSRPFEERQEVLDEMEREVEEAWIAAARRAGLPIAQAAPEQLAPGREKAERAAARRKRARKSARAKDRGTK